MSGNFYIFLGVEESFEKRDMNAGTKFLVLRGFQNRLGARQGKERRISVGASYKRLI